MLKDYIVNGKQYQYEEGKQPEGAVEVKKAGAPPVKSAEPENKAKKPANKSKAVVKK
jgi:hypothetical protein